MKRRDYTPAIVDLALIALLLFLGIGLYLATDWNRAMRYKAPAREITVKSELPKTIQPVSEKHGKH